MRFIILLLISFLITGCYDDSQQVSGRYYISSDIPINIQYTNEYGETISVTTNELNYVFKIHQEDVSDIFYHCIKWDSDVIQNVYIFVEFDDEQYTETDMVVKDKLNYESCLSYCVPWNTKCAKIRINF